MNAFYYIYDYTELTQTKWGIVSVVCVVLSHIGKKQVCFLLYMLKSNQFHKLGWSGIMGWVLNNLFKVKDWHLGTWGILGFNDKK